MGLVSARFMRIPKHRAKLPKWPHHDASQIESMLKPQTHARGISMVHGDWCETWGTMWVSAQMHFDVVVEHNQNHVAFGYIDLELRVKTVLA